MLEAEILETNSPKAAQWKRWIQRWEASGLSQANFCRDHGLKLATFGYWRKKFPAKPGTKPKGRLRLVPVGEVDQQPQSTQSSKQELPSQIITVEVNGATIRLDADFNTEALKRLLSVLKEV